MSSAVIDASALVERLVVARPVPGLHERFDDMEQLHAPHLIDAEVLNALRHLAARDELSTDAADFVRRRAKRVPIVRHPHVELSDRVWSMRDRLSAHDALYVALAEALELPLITCDARLGRTSGHRATIEVFAPGRS